MVFLWFSYTKMAKIAFRCAFRCQSSRKLAREATVTMSSAMYAALSFGDQIPGFRWDDQSRCFLNVFLNVNIWLMMVNDDG